MMSALRSRLVLSNLLIILLGLALLAIVFIQILNKQAERATDAKKAFLQQQSRTLAAEIQRLYQNNGSPQDLRTQVALAHRLLGWRVIVVNGRGQVRLDSNSGTPFANGSWQLNPQALREGKRATQALKSKSLYVFQSPLRGTSGNRRGGAVLVVARVTDVRPSLSSLQDFVALSILTALLVWLLLGLYFTQSVFRPLLRVTAATTRVARGDYTVRVPAQRTGELGRLAAAFNEMAQQVQQTNRVLKDFVANVSHDLRTPLTMINGFSQALLDGTAKPDEVQESAAVIHEEAIKMQRLVDDLLELTKLESGLLQLRQHPTQLQTFLQGVVDRVSRGQGLARVCPILTNVDTGLPLVELDAAQFERALTNLLNNAVEHTPPVGKVLVSATRVSNREVEIAVSDTGLGISAEDVPRLFERFYRSDKSRDRLEGHSGLGLAIAREIVEAHGGRISVDSVVGRGTTFRITLPLPAEQEASASEISTSEAVGQAAPS